MIVCENEIAPHLSSDLSNNNHSMTSCMLPALKHIFLYSGNHHCADDLYTSLSMLVHVCVCVCLSNSAQIPLQES